MARFLNPFLASPMMQPNRHPRNANRQIAVFVGSGPDAISVVEPALEGQAYEIEFVDVDDELGVDVVLDVVGVVGTTRPMMSTRSQLHFDPVPGSVVSSLVHTPPALLSQLVQVPASTMLSALESAHVIMVVNWKVLKRQVPPPSEHGAVTPFPHGFVFWAYTSPQLSESALK